jgi:hypothetical protein
MATRRPPSFEELEMQTLLQLRQAERERLERQKRLNRYKLIHLEASFIYS